MAIESSNEWCLASSVTFIAVPRTAAHTMAETQDYQYTVLDRLFISVNANGSFDKVTYSRAVPALLHFFSSTTQSTANHIAPPTVTQPIQKLSSLDGDCNTLAVQTGQDQWSDWPYSSRLERLPSWYGNTTSLEHPSWHRCSNQ